MSSWKIYEAVFSFQCPVQSHWKYRAEAHCSPIDSYFCLFDRYRNDQNFTEFCRGNSDFEAPGNTLTRVLYTLNVLTYMYLYN